jgi:hypothetical protein
MRIQTEVLSLSALHVLPFERCANSVAFNEIESVKRITSGDTPTVVFVFVVDEQR